MLTLETLSTSPLPREYWSSSPNRLAVTFVIFTVNIVYLLGSCLGVTGLWKLVSTVTYFILTSGIYPWFAWVGGWLGSYALFSVPFVLTISIQAIEVQ